MVSPNNSVSFFESLSFIGWMGIVVWILFVVVILWRPRWFASYDDRFPKSSIFEHLMYEEWHYIIFMVIRFIIIVLILAVVTNIMYIL